MAAKDLTPEKKRLVSALQGRKKDTYCDKTLHQNKHAKRKQSNWLFDQAVDKCGGAGADGAERRAAALIYGACDLQKVALDPAVEALVWSANEKVQATVVTSIHKYFQDPDRSLAAKVFLMHQMSDGTSYEKCRHTRRTRKLARQCGWC